MGILKTDHNVYSHIIDANPCASGRRHLVNVKYDLTLTITDSDPDPAAERWMKKRAVRNYYDALEKLRQVDRRCRQE